MTFRDTPTDRANAAKIQLARGGISITAALQVALEETANGRPVVAVLPQIAPPKDVKPIADALRTIADEVRFVCESGLPPVCHDGNEIDNDLVMEARSRFFALLANMSARAAEISAAYRLLAHLPSHSLKKLQAATERLQVTRSSCLAEASRDTTTNERRQFLRDFVTNGIDPILAWHEAVGLVRPDITKNR